MSHPFDHNQRKRNRHAHLQNRSWFCLVRTLANLLNDQHWPLMLLSMHARTSGNKCWLLYIFDWWTLISLAARCSGYFFLNVQHRSSNTSLSFLATDHGNHLLQVFHLKTMINCKLCNIALLPEGFSTGTHGSTTVKKTSVRSSHLMFIVVFKQCQFDYAPIKHLCSLIWTIAIAFNVYNRDRCLYIKSMLPFCDLAKYWQ